MSEAWKTDCEPTVRGDTRIARKARELRQLEDSTPWTQKGPPGIKKQPPSESDEKERPSETFRHGVVPTRRGGT